MVDEKEIASRFPDLEKELVTDIAAVGGLRSFPDGSILMKTGQYIRSTMIVVDGVVKVYRQDDEGSEFFMYYIEPGQACALSLVCSSKQDTSELTAKAVGDVEVITIPLDKMDEWMTKYPSWYRFVLSTYRKRFEELLQTIDQIAFQNMDQRLIFYLKKNQESLKTNVLPLTHAEIAAELNSSREVVSRLMKKLADKGMIKMNRQNIEIINLDV